LISIVVLLSAILMALQDRPARTAETPWHDLEAELRQQGKPTDARSLTRLAASESENEGTRWMAIEVLGLRGDKQAIETMNALLRPSESRLIRESAALALARLGDRRGIAALEQMVGSAEDPERRLSLAGHLAEFGSPVGYKYARQAALSETERLRYLSVGALVPFIPLEAAFKEERIDASDRLVALLQDKSPDVRQEVLLYLSLAVEKGLPIQRVRPQVESMTRQDKEPSLKEAARLLLIAWDEKLRQSKSKG